MKDTESLNGHAVEEKNIKSYGLGHRHVQSGLVFLIVSVSYIMRSNISVGIMAMTDKSTNITNVEIYDWDKKVQDFVLGSFFWGYMAGQIPASQLAQIFGAKKLLFGSMMINGVATLLFAQIVHMGGWMAACAVRSLQGITQSCMMPSVQIFLSRWAPLSERSRIGNLVMSGAPFGIILSMPTVGFLSGRFGWPVAFQVIGAVALTTGIIWVWMGSDAPALHSKITLEEREFIESSLGQKNNLKTRKTPWKAMFTSKPFLALLIVHTGCNWGYLTMLLETPSFLRLVLGVSSENSGLYSSLPYLAMFIFSFVLSYISDLVINKKLISISNTRKAANIIACTGLGFGILIMSYVPVDQLALSITILTIATGLCAALNVGHLLNHVDLAPNFAGAMMGITNAAANAVGTLAPLSVGYILKDPTDITQWRIVFIMICVIMNGCTVIYLIFGTSVEQPWNNTPEEEIEMKNKDAETEVQLLKS